MVIIKQEKNKDNIVKTKIKMHSMLIWFHKNQHSV